MLHLEWDGGVARIAFPEMVGGMSQRLLEDDDPRLERLRADAKRTQPATRYCVVFRVNQAVS